MGYRSEVMAVFYTTSKEEFPLLKLFVEENWPKEGSLSSLEWLKAQDHFGYVFHEEDVKWYESFPEVQAFYAFVRSFRVIADSEEKKQSWFYEFARIGEDYNDIETEYSLYSDGVLSVSRAIRLDV